MRRTALGIALTTILTAFLTACTPTADGTTPSGANTPTASPSSTAAQIPDELALLGVTEIDSPDGTPYARVTLAQDHPARTLDPALVDSAITDAGFTHEQLAQITDLAASYVVEEGVDSILVNADRVEEWSAANLNRYSPDTHADVTAALAERTESNPLRGIIDNGVLGKRKATSMPLSYEPGQPRIARFHMQTEEYLMSPGGDPAVAFTGFLVRPFTNPDGDLNGELLCFRQTLSYEQVDGQWLISGWLNNYRYADTDFCAEVGYDDRWGTVGEE